MAHAPAPRVALALSGKVGLLHGRFNDGRDSPRESGAAFRVVGRCLRGRVREYNNTGGSIRVFVHSWDVHLAPLVAATLEAMSARALRDRACALALTCVKRQESAADLLMVENRLPSSAETDRSPRTGGASHHDLLRR